MVKLFFDSFNLFRVKDFHLHYRAINTTYCLCDYCARCYATEILFCFTSSFIDELINYNDYYSFDFATIDFHYYFQEVNMQYLHSFLSLIAFCQHFCNFRSDCFGRNLGLQLQLC